MLAAEDPALEPPGAHDVDRDRLGHRGIAPGALGRIEDVEHDVGAVGVLLVGGGADGAVDGADPGLDLGIDGDIGLLGVGRRRLVEHPQQGCRRMLALAVDQTGAGRGNPHPPAAAVGDAHAREKRRSALAANPAGDRLAVTLDDGLDHGTIGYEMLGLLPDRFGEQALEVGTSERQHFVQATCMKFCCSRDTATVAGEGAASLHRAGHGPRAGPSPE